MEFFKLSAEGTWTGELLDILNQLAGMAGNISDLIGLTQ